jgi:hypothetical protein
VVQPTGLDSGKCRPPPTPRIARTAEVGQKEFLRIVASGISPRRQGRQPNRSYARIWALPLVVQQTCAHRARMSHTETLNTGFRPHTHPPGSRRRRAVGSCSVQLRAASGAGSRFASGPGLITAPVDRPIPVLGLLGAATACQCGGATTFEVCLLSCPFRQPAGTSAPRM